jgi:hypothetical protein
MEMERHLDENGVQIIYADHSESIESWPLDPKQGSIEPVRESVLSH